MTDKIVACPTCQQSVVWSSTSRWRPFCSERCYLIDLGEWLNERHVIPGEPIDPEQLNDPSFPQS